MLDKSQWIYLERKGTEGKQGTYVVKGKESLYEISQTCAIQLSYLLAYNGLEVDDVAAPGMVLQLKSYVSEKNSKTSSKKEKLSKKQKNTEEKNADEDEKVTVKTHRVRPGETLETISKKYKVTVAGLKKSNHLKSSRLKIGQKLIIEK
jgi:LysM repeat protein